MTRTNDDRRERAAEEAARWIVRLAADDVSANDRAEFQEWLAREPAHRTSYDELQRIWADVDNLAGVEGTDPHELPPALHDEVSRCGALRRAAASRFRLRRRAWIAAAAAIFVLGLWTGPALWRHLTPQAAATTASSMRTGVGERKQTMLADGSVVWLNAETDIQVAFTTTQRTVHLQNGEAFFHVAKDAERPFVVHVADRTITAVGTAFNVYCRRSKTRVTVLEGTVEVSRSPERPVGPQRAPVAAPGVEPALAFPGTEVAATRLTVSQDATLLGASTQITTLPAQKAAQVVAWRSGYLFFDRVTLRQIVEELGPYLDARIVVADPSIQGFVGGGVVQVDSAASILRAIEIAWPVTVSRPSPDLIVLTRRR